LRQPKRLLLIGRALDLRIMWFGAHSSQDERPKRRRRSRRHTFG
jgi:hypothetical protein